MDRRARFSTVCLFLIPFAVHGCAATPSEQAQAVAPEAAPTPTVTDAVTHAPPPGVPIDVYTEEAVEPRSVWTSVHSSAVMNLSTGSPLVTVTVQGRLVVDEPVVVVQPVRWRVTEAIDQDGRAIPLPAEREDHSNETPAAQFAEAYLAAMRGESGRWLPIHAQLTDLSERPRILRKLAVVAQAAVIRKVEERALESPGIGQPIEFAPGVTAVIDEPEPVSGDLPRRLLATVRIDPLLPDDARPLIVGAGVIDAAGVAVDAAGINRRGQGGTIAFTIHTAQRLTDPLRLRLIVATDVGKERITCVARDIPVP